MKRKKVTIPRIEALQARANIYCLIKNAQGLLRAKNNTFADTLKMSLPSFERHINWMIKAGFLRQFRDIEEDIKAPSVYGLGVYPLDRFIQFLTFDCYAKLSLEIDKVEETEEVDEVSRIRITIESIDRSKRSFDETSWFIEAKQEIDRQQLEESLLEVITVPISSKFPILRALPKYGVIDINGIQYGEGTIYVWQTCEGKDLFCGQDTIKYILP